MRCHCCNKVGILSWYFDLLRGLVLHDVNQMCENREYFIERKFTGKKRSQTSLLRNFLDFAGI